MHCKIHYKIEITSRMSLKACFFFECSIFTYPPTTARLDATQVAACQWRQVIVCNKSCKPCLTINPTCGICWICCNAHYMNLNTTHMDVLAIPPSVGATYFTQPSLLRRLCCITSCMQSKSNQHPLQQVCLSCITMYRDCMNNCMDCKIHYKI